MGKPTEKKKLTSPINKWLKFSNIGIQMAATIVICVLLGRWLDGKYPNLYPLFTVVLSLFGVFASLYLVYKQVTEMSEKNKE